jgi:hypothetical protein
MQLQKLTAKFIVGIIALIAAFDVFVYSKGGTEATISYVIMTWSYQHPITVFVAGVVCGHLYWRIRDVGGKKQG